MNNSFAMWKEQAVRKVALPLSIPISIGRSASKSTNASNIEPYQEWQTRSSVLFTKILGFPTGFDRCLEWRIPGSYDTGKNERINK
jgi:hypothetical protein